MSPFRAALAFLLAAFLFASGDAFKFRPMPSELSDATSLLQIHSEEAGQLKVAHQLKKMTAQKCKVMCQRFGMKALASLNSKFKGITNPTECVPICDEVFQ
eukprot:TRINITY_DN582_c0_g2_i1.p1 TRINITY_DN582_c0_g2~~TRINITY_DN582_c0_g2_i1.p1  ORF type:complete len:101 (+),score=29.36 TRINITY_DN582_c0_g2_i1:108-410(+)